MSPGQGSKAANTQARGCNTDDLYIINGLFRTVFGRAAAQIEQTKPEDKTQVARVAGFLKEIAQTLLNHHHHEDALWWDRINERAPESREDVLRMHRSHQDIARLIESLQASLDAWHQAPGDKRAVIQQLNLFNQALEEHLSDEETHIKPVAARVLTQAEWNEAAERGIQEIPRNRLPVQMGFLMACAPSQALRDAFWKTLPIQAKLMYKLMGKRLFEQEWQALYGKTPRD